MDHGKIKGEKDMRQPNSKQVAELTEKLKSQGDITEQEADTVRSLFLRDFAKAKLEPKSPEFDRELFNGLTKFAETALGLIKQEKTGIFISSFPNLPPNPSLYICRDLYETVHEISGLLPVTDTVAIFNVCFDKSAKGKNETIEINGADILKDTHRSEWEDFGYNGHTTFWGYRPDYLGFFRRSNIKKAFGNYETIPVVLDPFLHYAMDFFFKQAEYDVINEQDILSCAVTHLINRKKIPFLIYGYIYNDIREDMSLEGCEHNNYIAVDAGLARKITKAVQENEQRIIAEMTDLGAIRPSKDYDYINSLIYDIEECSGAGWLVRSGGVNETFSDGNWYRFDNYRETVNLASRLLEETLKYGKTINCTKDEESEKDIWIAEGR